MHTVVWMVMHAIHMAALTTSMMVAWGRPMGYVLRWQVVLWLITTAASAVLELWSRHQYLALPSGGSGSSTVGSATRGVCVEGREEPSETCASGDSGQQQDGPDHHDSCCRASCKCQ